MDKRKSLTDPKIILYRFQTIHTEINDGNRCWRQRMRRKRVYWPNRYVIGIRLMEGLFHMWRIWRQTNTLVIVHLSCVFLRFIQNVLENRLRTQNFWWFKRRVISFFLALAIRLNKFLRNQLYRIKFSICIFFVSIVIFMEPLKFWTFDS